MQCRVAAVKCLLVLHHSAYFIYFFISSGILETILITLQIENNNPEVQVGGAMVGRERYVGCVFVCVCGGGGSHAG